jgi:hypothetical protein
MPAIELRIDLSDRSNDRGQMRVIPSAQKAKRREHKKRIVAAENAPSALISSAISEIATRYPTFSIRDVRNPALYWAQIAALLYY